MYTKFVVMLISTIALGIVDIFFGIGKCVMSGEKFTSDKMSKGLVKKMANVLAIGCFMGVDMFIAFSNGIKVYEPKFTYIFFIYIVAMEFKSLGENYKAITGSNAVIDTFEKVIKKGEKENDT